VEEMKQPCKQPLIGRFTGPKRLLLLFSIGSAVQRGHFVCVMPRAVLLPLSTLGVVGGRLMLPGTLMHCFHYTVTTGAPHRALGYNSKHKTRILWSVRELSV
jgi:hypothetical protein